MKTALPPDQTALPLNPQWRSDVALRQILLAELASMALNEACLIQQYDVGCLHDYRIAVRRSRIVLAHIPDVFPSREVRRFTSKLSGLSENTGPCRDLDVLLQHWPEYVVTTDPVYRQLHGYLQLQSEKARCDVVAALSGQHHIQFMHRWREFLLQQPAVTRMQNADLPVSLLASTTLESMLQKLLKRLHAITPSSADSQLHKSRIITKRLRYLLDYFLFPDTNPAYRQLIPELKKLQAALGVNQDLCMQKSMILSIKKQMMEAGLMSVDTRHALQDVKKSIKKRANRQRELALKAIKRFLRSDALAAVLGSL